MQLMARPRIILRDIHLKGSQDLWSIGTVSAEGSWKAEEPITQPYLMTLEVILSFMVQKGKKIKLKVIKYLWLRDRKKSILFKAKLEHLRGRDSILKKSIVKLRRGLNRI